jgi:site-specific DNA-methyltransferase (adenine-specific)
MKPYKRKELIGDAVLYLGDSLEIMPEIPDKEFQLAIVDPPYFDGPNKLGYYGARESSCGVFRGDFKKIGKWNVPEQQFFDDLSRISYDQIAWGINYFPIKHLGTGRIVWDKCNENSTFSDCEIAFCSKIDHVKKFTFMWNGMLQGKSISEGSLAQGNKKLNEERTHPTQKPVALYRWLLKNYAKEGDHILDTHGGSMSSVIACLEMGFKITCIEIDEDYFNAGCERVRQAQRQGKLFTPPKPKPEQGSLL